MHGEDDAYYHRVATWSSSARYESELERLALGLSLPRDAAIIDVGCGTGTALDWFRGRGARAIGIDRSDAWARACRSPPVVQGDAARLPFRDGSFDGAILMHALAHIVAPKATLGEIRRLLRPGGRLAIVTPNRRYLRALNRIRPFAPRYTADPTVESHFTREAATELLESTGFVGVEATPFGKLPWSYPLPSRRERLLISGTRAPEEAR